MKKITQKEKTRLLAFAKDICNRPSMFTGGPPSFQNLTYFFDGYLFATEERLKIEVVVPFSSWLADKFKAKFHNYPYSTYIMEQYKTEEMQFTKLYELFEEFLSSNL